MVHGNVSSCWLSWCVNCKDPLQDYKIISLVVFILYSIISVEFILNADVLVILQEYFFMLSLIPWAVLEW